MSIWEAGRDYAYLPDADGPTGDCPARSAMYVCTRDAGHAGRHLAGVGTDQLVAAWPGDHEPTAADLTEVPS